MYVIIDITKGINIMDNWLLTQIVRFLLSFILFIIVSMVFQKIFSKEK